MKSFLSSTFFVLLTFLLPPAAVVWRHGFGWHFLIDLLLTLMGYIPGLLYAVVLFLFTAPETETVSAKATIKRGGIAGGTVYVLSNPEIPGVVKIGHTTRSPTERARELSGTSVPGEYKVSYETKVDRPEKVEKEVHRKLSNHRASSGEFFEVSPRRAAKVIEEVS